MLFIDRLAKVAHDPIVQGVDPVNVFGIGRHQDCRYRVPHLDEVPVEFDSCHRRHIDISDQARRFDESR